MNFDKLDRLLTHLVEDKGVPGVEIAIHQGGNEIYRGFEGFADREAERLHSGRDIYNLYSMSKVITCTAALRLFEEGTALAAACNKQLDTAERKVVRLMKGADGNPVETEFEEHDA